MKTMTLKCHKHHVHATSHLYHHEQRPCVDIGTALIFSLSYIIMYMCFNVSVSILADVATSVIIVGDCRGINFLSLYKHA